MTNEVCLGCEGIERYLGEGEERVHALARHFARASKQARSTRSSARPAAARVPCFYVLGLLDPPDRGQVTIESEPVSQLSDDELSRKRNELLGFIFQFHFLMEDFTAQENVMIPMRRLGRLTEEAMRARAAELLEAVGLGNKLSRPSRHLSGGEQQRVAVARALANDPRVILADEPTGNLDTKNSQRAFELLQNVVVRDSKTLLLVTHNPDIAGACDWIHEMQDGQIIGSRPRGSNAGLATRWSGGVDWFRGSACELPNPEHDRVPKFSVRACENCPSVYCRGDSAGQLCKVLLRPQST